MEKNVIAILGALALFVVLGVVLELLGRRGVYPVQVISDLFMPPASSPPTLTIVASGVDATSNATA